MALKVIGAGFGRTGTLSLKRALEELGFGPCYHMVEVFQRKAESLWNEAADGRPDWERIFEGYRSSVDWPGATYYATLAEIYPDAKVILTVRDAEDWFRSTQATIFPKASPPEGDAPFDRLFREVIARLFDNRLREHDHVIAVYRRHNEEVKRRIPASRLLVYDVAEGWPPLSRFLGVPVPESAMPKLNSTAEFNAGHGARLRTPAAPD